MKHLGSNLLIALLLFGCSSAVYKNDRGFIYRVNELPIPSEWKKNGAGNPDLLFDAELIRDGDYLAAVNLREVPASRGLIKGMARFQVGKSYNGRPPILHVDEINTQCTDVEYVLPATLQTSTYRSFFMCAGNSTILELTETGKEALPEHVRSRLRQLIIDEVNYETPKN